MTKRKLLIFGAGEAGREVLNSIIKDINNKSDYYDKMIESCKKRYYLENVSRLQDEKMKELNSMVDNMIIMNEQLYYSLKFNL